MRLLRRVVQPAWLGLLVKEGDRDRTSGLEQMQVTNKKRRPGELREFKARSRFSSAGPRIYVRVWDLAGNFSRWKKAARRRAPTPRSLGR